MPIYEYSCQSCGDIFEKLVRRTEDVLESGCPACGQKHLKQAVSTFSARAAGRDSISGRPSPAEMRNCASGMCCAPGTCGSNN